MLPNTQKSIILLISSTLLICLVFSGRLYAAHALPEFNAIYAIEKFGLKVAEAKYQLEHTATGYKFSQSSKLHGFASLFRNDTINAVSYVDQAGDKLLLKKHSYRQTGKEKNRDEEFSIDWVTESSRLTGNISGIVRSKQIKLEADTEVWEALSFQIPLMIDARPDKKEYLYNAILKGEIDTYNFELKSIEQLNFSGKEYQALQMVRTDPEKDRQIHIWLLPELINIPVIIENYRDGKEHSRMQLESLQLNNQEPITKQAELIDDDF